MSNIHCTCWGTLAWGNEISPENMCIPCGKDFVPLVALEKPSYL